MEDTNRKWKMLTMTYTDGRHKQDMEDANYDLYLHAVGRHEAQDDFWGPWSPQTEAGRC